MDSGTKTRMFWPDFVRAIASFAVVMIHVHSWGFDSLSDRDKTGFLLINIFCYWSVPAFVMLSGFLLLTPSPRHASEDTFTFVKKRWKRMIRPTLAWACVAVLWDALALRQSTEELVMRVVTGVPIDPQWFLFMLLGLYFLTPWLRLSICSEKFDRKHLCGAITVLYLINLIVLVQIRMGYVREIPFPANSLTYLDIYLFGVLAGDRNSWGRGTDRVIWLAAAVLAIFAASMAILKPSHFDPSGWGLLTNYHSPFVLLMATAIFRGALRYFGDTREGEMQHHDDSRFARLVRTLSDWSFGIYVIHPFVRSVLFKTFLRPIDGPFLPYCFVIWTVTMAISCIACYLAKKSRWTAWLIP